MSKSDLHQSDSAQAETCASEVVLLDSMHTVCVDYQKSERVARRIIRRSAFTDHAQWRSKIGMPERQVNPASQLPTEPKLQFEMIER
jgi:hypothetical protein